MNNLSQASFFQKQIDREELADLFQKAKEGDSASRERIILAYYPLAKSIAAKYEDNGVPFEDLIQEAFLGITHALNNFEFEVGTPFGSYAKIYIEKYIRRAILTQSDNAPIVYKEDFFLEMQKYLQTLDDLTKRLMRTPSDKELADALHMTQTKIRKISQSIFSFLPEDTIFSNNESILSPEDTAMTRVLDLSCLNIRFTKRERDVVSRRLGFTDSGEPESLSEIAESLGLSHETVRLTYTDVIKRIKKAVEDQGYTISTIQI